MSEVSLLPIYPFHPILLPRGKQNVNIDNFKIYSNVEVHLESSFSSPSPILPNEPVFLSHVPSMAYSPVSTRDPKSSDAVQHPMEHGPGGGLDSCPDHPSAGCHCAGSGDQAES